MGDQREDEIRIELEPETREDYDIQSLIAGAKV